MARRHLRQFREDKDGNRMPIFPDNNAIIEIISDDKYIVKSSLGDIIAISGDLDTVIRRTKYAQPNADIYVKCDGELLTLKRYKQRLMPTIYRVLCSTGHAGWLAVVDCIKDGQVSDIQIFNSPYQVSRYIIEQQRNDGHYYVYKYGTDSDEINAGGLDDYQLDYNIKDMSALSQMLKQERSRLNRSAGRV